MTNPSQDFLEMFADELYDFEQKYGMKINAIRDGSRELELYDYKSGDFFYVWIER